MDTQFLGRRTPRTISLIAYALIVLAILSCCARPDFNVIIGFFVLLLRSFDSSNKKVFFSKACLHILLISCIFDFFWIFKYTGKWRHGKETSDLWKSLAFAHNTSYYFGYLEFCLKIPLIIFYYKQFRSYGTSIKELFKIKYNN